MSRRFLTNIDLQGNELINGVIENRNGDPATGEPGQVYFNTVDQVLKVYNGSTEEWQAVGSEEFIGDTVAALIQSGNGISVDYDDPNDTLTIANTGVLSVAGTQGEITVSASAGDVTIGLPDQVGIQELLTVVPGTIMNGNTPAFQVGSNFTTINVPVDINSSVDIQNSLTVGASASFQDDVVVDEDLTVGQNLLVSGSANFQDNVLIDGGLDVVGETYLTDDVNVNSDLYVSETSTFTGLVTAKGGIQSDEYVNINETLTVGASAYFLDDVVVDGDMTIHGDLNVDGLVNAINRTEINLEDNTIRLNSGLSASATPTADAEIIVERGAEDNAALRWNETLNVWEIGFENGSYEAIIATNDLDEDVEDIVANLVDGSNSLSITYDDNAGTLTFDTVLQSGSPSYLVQNDGLAVDLPTLETQLIADSFTRKAAANVGNGTNVSFALVHNFNTRDVVVNVYDNATYDTVEVDVVRTDADTVTVTFAEAPDASAYRVVIIG